MLKLFCFSDLHSDTYVLERLIEKAVNYQPDAIFITGDMTNSDMTPLNLLLDLADKFPTFFVRGNNDTETFAKELSKKAESLDFRKATLDSIIIIGVGGSLRTPFSTVNEYTETQYASILDKLGTAEILLTHNPPYGYFDFVRNTHTGSKAILEYINRTQPWLVFSGHIHNLQGSINIGKSLLIKLGAASEGDYATIELSKEHMQPNIKFKKVY